MKLFDFLIVPVYRSGGTAIQRFVSLQPNVVAIPKSTLDGALEGGNEEQLLAEFQPLMHSSPDFKLGLVQHKYVVEHFELEEIAERLSRIVRKDGLVLIFREHVDAIISSINHRNIVAYCDYSFAKAGLSWPDKAVVTDDLNELLHDFIARSGKPLDPAEKILPPETFVGDRELNRFRYAEIQETYERYFNHALVLDYADILSRKNEDAVRRLARHMGVVNEVYIPFFSMQQAGRSHRFLAHNMITVTSDNLSDLQVAMRSRVILDYAIEVEGTELTTVGDDYIRDKLGFPDGLSLSTMAPFSFHEAGRKQQITIRHEARRFQREFFYPLWRYHYDAVSNVIDPFLVHTLPTVITDRMERELDSDTEKFFEKNSDIGHSWKKQ